MRDRILKALSERGDLPSLPDIVVKLQRMIHDPSSNAREIARLIELEPVLAGRIIQLANSVYYSRSPEPIKTLQLAITKIGLAMLTNLVCTLKLGTLFDGNRVLDGRQFWRHSMAVAFLALDLSHRARSRQEQQDEAYLAGLMHDVGIMVFGYLIPEEYRAFSDTVRTSGEPLHVMETRAFGIDHAELGARYTEIWWKVDKSVSAAIGRHHIPDATDASGRSTGLYVYPANELCNSEGINNGIDSHHEQCPVEQLHLDIAIVENIDAILLEVQTSVTQAEQLLYMNN